jgi:predicted metal-dependent phosphoesterase TrpH
MDAGRAAGVEIVPGVEINTDYPGEEVHVLGYYPDLDDIRFLGLLAELRESRHSRLDLMIDKLRSLGCDVSRERVLEIAGGAAPGRLHVAKALCERNHAQSVRDAFSKYLAIGAPAYVGRAKVDPFEAVTLLREAGAVPVLAHPGLLSSQAIVPGLVERGLLGLEAYYPGHDQGTVLSLLMEAERYGLIVTGGSDSHGAPEAHTGEVGSVRVPYEHVEAIRKARLGIRPQGH